MLSDLKSPPEWRRDIEKLVLASKSKPIVAMITGPKSSGKSTFGKLLNNQLLTDATGKRQAGSVAIMDLDPGQPEHGMPGQVSLVRVTEPLFGPSFCRPLPGLLPDSGTTVIRSHTLAAISPASDPKLYLAAAADLLNHYQNRLGSLPLIINTPGWIQGTGLDLLVALVSLFRPSHLVYMGTGPFDVIESLQANFKSGALMQLPSQTTQYTSRTAAHLRSMQAMSYFHANHHTPTKSKFPPGWDPDPLSTVPPWQLAYAGSTPGMLGIMCYDYQAPSDLLCGAINGTILAVVEIESSSAFYVPTAEDDVREQEAMNMDSVDTNELSSLEYVRKELTTITPEGIPFINSGSTLNPRYSQTIGLALVRGIDTENSVLQVLTPISEDRIQQINEKGGQIVLVSGRFDPPSWAYTEDLYHQAASFAHGDEESDEEEQLDAMGEGPAEAQSRHELEESETVSVSVSTPWIEVLHGNQKRGIGSRVWRVRRDLGRTGTTGD
jgi:polynucleotide 5'-hydroxyl-kinase GRC3/NOL9